MLAAACRILETSATGSDNAPLPPSSAADIGVVIAALGVAAVFLYRSGQFSKQPDHALSARFPAFRTFIVVSLCSALLSVLAGVSDMYTLAPVLAEISGILFVTSVVAVVGAAVALLTAVSSKFGR